MDACIQYETKDEVVKITTKIPTMVDIKLTIPEAAAILLAISKSYGDVTYSLYGKMMAITKLNNKDFTKPIEPNGDKWNVAVSQIAKQIKENLTERV